MGINITPTQAMERLRQVIDPEVGLNIVDMGLVYEVTFESENRIKVKMTLTTPGCPMGPHITDNVRSVLMQVEGVQGVDVELVWEPQWTPDKIIPGAMEKLRNGEV